MQADVPTRYPLQAFSFILLFKSLTKINDPVAFLQRHAVVLLFLHVFHFICGKASNFSRRHNKSLTIMNLLNLQFCGQFPQLITF